MLVLGIDPGLKGGYAIYSDNYESGFVKVFPMPVYGKEIDVSKIREHFMNNHWNTRSIPTVYIEKCSSMPKQGVCSVFKFGKGYGQIIGLCQAFGWPYELVRPMTWKNIVLSDTAKDKDAAIAVAKRLFPHIDLILPGCRVPHDGLADALCILQYGILKERGEICLEKQKHKSQK